MIRVELRKLVLRPRTWVSMLLLCLLPAIVAVFLATADFAPPPGQGGAFLSAVVGDGTLYPAAALALVLPLFLPIAVAVTAGDAVAGDASTGTLRYLLIRPVGRTRLLTAKLVSVAVYVTLAIVVVVLTSLVIGVLLFGTGAQPGASGAPPAAAVSLSGVQLSSSSLVLRLLGAVLYVVLSMVGFAAITLFLSTVTDSAIGAALGGLAVLITSSVLETLDAAAPVKPFLPTHYWLSWLDFFRDPVLWRNIDHGLLLQAGYIVVFFGAAWANFATKDVTD
ncbi:ABC transporter permease [Amycolatopsis sp. FDAARGOS 1241]|uniref:ABC transporter permease n=1 Tax=Amycolatopsis sp. FDAARGOS 1241 TaxID=2778070 RepID=UPI00194EA33C|nr:ABC transporter permease subunit [Amycolatopsis sp. FDAARGOS 1241]QRP46944.1 ABC transporter permease subunit [Amycolatopsis sp. FDAARGOS 1241]